MEITRNKQYTEDYLLFSEELTKSKESKTTIADILEDKKFNIDDIDSCIVLQQLNETNVIILLGYITHMLYEQQKNSI